MVPGEPSNEAGEVTRLLHAWKDGDQQAFHALVPLVYQDLHNVAVWQMKSERDGHTLSPTALLHESFLRLVKSGVGTEFQDRKHFFLVAARAMRRLLIDHARSKGAAKRAVPQAPVEEGLPAGQPWDVIDMDRVLTRLEEEQPRRAKMVELRYFAGFTVREIADALDTSIATVSREMRTTEAWLAREIKRS